MKDLLINRIVDAIVASDLLEPEKKLLAFEDILQMYKDPEYYIKCRIERHENFRKRYTNTNSLLYHHEWRNSNLGESFWNKMDDIIGTV